MDLKTLVDDAFRCGTEKGWWPKPGEPAPNFPEKLCLIHSEISEALEEHRQGKAPDEIYTGIKGDPLGIPIELADVLIRIFDLAGYYRIDLENAVKLKMAYNATRSFRHGGKTC